VVACFLAGVSFLETQRLFLCLLRWSLYLHFLTDVCWMNGSHYNGGELEVFKLRDVMYVKGRSGNGTRQISVGIGDGIMGV